MAVETPKVGATPPVEKAKEPQIVAETPIMSEARKKLLTYAMLGIIFREMSSQAAEPVEPKVEPKA